jgi:signal transduction histidine kinase
MKNIDADNELIPYMLVEHQAPWLIPSSRTIFFNEAVINFEDIAQFKQSEVETRQKQLRLESVNEQLNDLVAGQTEQIGQLASEVLLAGHKVRTAVSHLLHDDLQQILVSMKLKILAIEQLQSIDEDILHGQLLELFEATNLAIAVTRQVASDLKPPILSNKDFMALIQWLVKVMNRQYGLVVEVKGSVRPSWLKEEVSSFLFQTIRELLFNVVKHAGVNEVLVEVSEASDRLSIAVSDSGEGFDTAITMQQPSSLGLFNIRRQLELFGGQFQIESQPGLGTRAVVVVRR